MERCGSRSLALKALSSVSEIRSRKASAAHLLFPVRRVSAGCPDLTSRSSLAFLFVDKNNVNCDSCISEARNSHCGESPNFLTISLDTFTRLSNSRRETAEFGSFRGQFRGWTCVRQRELHPGSNHGQLHAAGHGCASCLSISDICQDNVRTVAV